MFIQDTNGASAIGSDMDHVSSKDGVTSAPKLSYASMFQSKNAFKSINICELHDVDLTVVAMDDQVIHTCIRFKIDKKELFCSFIYAHNRYTQRRPLWRNLIIHKHYVRNRPWCLLGDFNSALNLEDRVEGSSVIDIAMREFKECVEVIEVFDVNRSGLQFTWNQKPRGTDGKLKKIDRIMANLAFTDAFIGAHAIFQPYRISDHSPAILTIPTSHKFTPRPFKFYNIIVQNSQFKGKVKEFWDMDVSGFHMYKVVSKLKSLKKPLRKLLYNEGNIHDKVIKLRHELDTPCDTTPNLPEGDGIRADPNAGKFQSVTTNTTNDHVVTTGFVFPTGPIIEGNSITSKHDYIEGVFGVSLKSALDIDLFLKKLEAGKHPIWPNLDSEARSQVYEAMCGLWEVYGIDMKADATNSDVSVKDTTPNVNVDVNTQPIQNSTYSSLVAESGWGKLARRDRAGAKSERSLIHDPTKVQE
ncbi:RNA-directed DNA polymerase, eukaryota, Reverse transcriptase zinc-binding domain protein [Artemisia annua]|uniref:RNA-directed DNA polymerase, eukaryota, Reverse transcriptase zinc-binding domain protein n=1 Tax=Artemisia annua TaxID=35608 RepID=A0A2U1MJV9_ARTAN|nr:RNA-directed DNA polymerase, eukaryota, Reverse transcriptase zinc-binding domain protein [Artemisia annua]